MEPAVVIETRSLSKRFGGVVAADNVNFKVLSGEFRCMIGPNGAGKSTLFAMLCGIESADSGQIFVFGQDVTRTQAFRRVRLGVGLTFQTNRAFHQLSVRENLTIPQSSANLENKEAGQARLEFALDAFGLDPNDETKAAELAHNRLQWLEFAMVLVGYPNLILLDEPTAGMASDETLQTAKVLKHLNSTGLTTVVVEMLEYLRGLQGFVRRHSGRRLIQKDQVRVRKAWIEISLSCRKTVIPWN